MQQILSRALMVVVCLATAVVSIQARTVQLHSVQFPEKRPIELSFQATPIAPAAQLEANVYYRNGQGRIDLTFSDMKPAILFGGDVTCFVLWAVTRDGQVENLGELVTRKRSGRLEFSTGKKNFALMVTAESFFLVGQPSELVAFHNRGRVAGETESVAFTFEDFVDAPRHSMDGIAHIKWDSKVPIELLQARKAIELAERHDAHKHAKQVYIEAGAMLKHANTTAANAPKSRELLDYSRRAVALSNEALNISMKRMEAIELEQQIAKRRAETKALERRAAQAEEDAEQARLLAEDARRMADEARRMADEVRAEKERTMAETAALRQEKTGLESAMVAMNQDKLELEQEAQRLLTEKTALQAESQRLRTERTALEAESQRLQGERDELHGRLQSALSHVADTQDSARGFVVNLPDILFAVNEATLKPEAQLVLAKLAGILLILPGQTVTIEGHTDSTGSPDYNLDLSQRRATAVLHLLRSQGLTPGRLNAVGFGMQRPVADNTTADGRGRNRRVEIVISEAGRAVAAN
jgi:outer membrane protein OmpA-like peptidoglycan-associated protein